MGSFDAFYFLTRGIDIRHRYGQWVVLLVMMPVAAWADVAMVREVVVSSKTGPATANIGPVHRSCDIEMKEARVDITVGEPQKEREDLVIVETRAVFLMANTSDNELVLTVGFPVSDSTYSAFKLIDFKVTSNQQEKSVFNRITHYPSHLEHSWVSGPQSSPDELPDAASTRDLFGNYHGDLENKTAVTEEAYKENATRPRRVPRINLSALLSPKAVLRADRSAIVHNLMVWREDFSPKEERTIEVRYAMEIPLQKNKSVTKQIVTNGKGILIEEANNCPHLFLKTLKWECYYFFDYFLTTGASWKGPIGGEIITLHLPEYWRGQQPYCSKPDRLKQTDPLTWIYTLTNEEPQENLYFALPKRMNK